MGSPVSPIVANLFMEDFELKALASFQHPPRFWGRYVDDTMVIIKTIHFEGFTNHLNQQHPSIAFTSEYESNNSIPMLDTLIHKDLEGNLSFSIYRKATLTDQYFDSHQPLEHKLGVIRTLTHRAKIICSTVAAKELETQHLKKVLSISKYPRWAWDTPGSSKQLAPKRHAAQRPTKQTCLCRQAGRQIVPSPTGLNPFKTSQPSE